MIPSMTRPGKRLHSELENHHFQWENQLFQWLITNRTMENHHVEWENQLFRLGHVQ